MGLTTGLRRRLYSSLPKGLFGQGLYFAENASKSDEYTDNDDLHYMFLVRVCLGSPYYHEGNARKTQVHILPGIVLHLNFSPTPETPGP